MERHRCKLCYRRFSNGRALGGHMRSHAMLAAPISQASAPPPPPPPVPVHHQHHHYPLQSRSASSSSFSPAAAAATEEKAIPTYGLRENPRKSFRLADAEFSASFAAAAGSSSVVQDGESDAESSLRRRPKRLQGSTSQFAGGENEPLSSSVSDASPEEDVARSLVLLSRDSWSRFGSPEQRMSNDWDEREGDNGDEEEEGDDDDDDDERGAAASRSRQRKRTRYQCGNCRKVFRSYQALGGHRASHKRVGVECVATATDARAQIHAGVEFVANAGSHDAKVFQCPYCYRVFSSGQALGGHKRSHFAHSAAITSTAAAFLPPPVVHSTFIATNNSSIDLNLPAPLEEEAELSAVSVATEFPSK